LPLKIKGIKPLKKEKFSIENVKLNKLKRESDIKK
jgi:hypothetical protein